MYWLKYLVRTLVVASTKLVEVLDFRIQPSYALAAGLGTLNTQGIALEKDYNNHYGIRKRIGHKDSRNH
jgi:hypothetical protein